MVIAAKPARTKAAGSKAQVVNSLTVADLRAALVAGWSDYRAHPGYGAFFAAIYVAVGMLLIWASVTRGAMDWLVLAAAGFPLLAPFCAVGLYDVSRRREAGLPLNWGAVLGALRGRGDDQILSMGVILFVGFGFWLMIAHGIFAVFMADAGLGTNPMALFRTPASMLMLLVGSTVGAAIALAFYTLTVISLPMLVDRDVDFLTAIITSVRTVKANRAVLLIWALIVAAALFVAMIPAFLGLLVVLPVLGHATWHLYRRSIV
jgi:uncharacterized membrane protein